MANLNGTTVLIACLFWGFLWGLVGLILAGQLTPTGPHRRSPREELSHPLYRNIRASRPTGSSDRRGAEETAASGVPRSSPS